MVGKKTVSTTKEVYSFSQPGLKTLIIIIKTTCYYLLQQNPQTKLSFSPEKEKTSIGKSFKTMNLRIYRFIDDNHNHLVLLLSQYCKLGTYKGKTNFDIAQDFPTEFLLLLLDYSSIPISSPEIDRHQLSMLLI